MDQILTKKWWKAAGLRAIKTFCQAFVGTVSSSAVILSDVNWFMVLSASALATLLSFLTSIAGLPEVDKVDIDAIDVKGGE